MKSATSKTIEIIVSPTGQTRIETKGYEVNRLGFFWLAL
jgi:hypothetical protein